MNNPYDRLPEQPQESAQEPIQEPVQEPAPQAFEPLNTAPRRPKRGGKAGWAVFAVVLALAVGLTGGYLAKDLLPDLFAGITQPPQTQEQTPGANTPTVPPATQEPVFLPGDTPQDPMDTRQIYRDNVNSIVGIMLEGAQYNVFGSLSPYASSGTGFILSEDGYILTNYHVVKSESLEDPKITVSLYNGNTYTAVVIGHDEYSDVALLKIEATGLKPVNTGSSKDLVPGESIAIIGHPLGELTYSISRGIVAAVNREISVSKKKLEMFQIDAAVNGGNSGGPAFNDKGQVVGIVTSKYVSSSIEGLGFCIPIDNALKIANDLVNYGFVRGQAGLGVTIKTVYASNGMYQQRFGVQIQEIHQGSSAQKAMLQVGDVITKIDGESVTSTDEFFAVRSTYKAGDTAVLTVYREKAYVEITVTFDEFIPEISTQAPTLS